MIESFASWATAAVFGAEASMWADSFRFFVFETVKIGALLLVITHIMGAVNAFFPVERVREVIASGRLRGLEHLGASVFGAVTPFCSCSSIPLFLGFLQGQIPLGVTFSFLITSPLVNEVALALFLGMFGWKVTLTYAVSGILLGTLLGWALGKFRLERYVEDWVWKIAEKRPAGALRSPIHSLRAISSEAFGIIQKIGVYVLVGIGVGSLIHGFVPTGFFESFLNESNPLGVPLSVAIAVPMYASASGVIPVVQALVAKGVPLGTAMSFMMATVGLSLPEALILRKVMRPRLLGVFFGSVALSIVGLGYLFNLVY
jgi:uncharacterized protein